LVGEEQGPKGNGHTFESCRGARKAVPSVPGLWRLDWSKPAFSSVLKVAGSGNNFEDRGVHDLKGLAEGW